MNITFAQQSFEGEVTYTVSVQSHFIVSQDSSTLGPLQLIQHYYMKDANYKYASDINDMKEINWSEYIGKDKKFYSKSMLSDTVWWNDATIDIDTINKVELKKNDTTILGYSCDKLTFILNRGSDVYYFNSQFSVDPGLYIDHKMGNLYEFLKSSRSIALLEINKRQAFTLITNATSIKRVQVDDKVFELPKNLPFAEIKVK